MDSGIRKKIKDSAEKKKKKQPKGDAKRSSPALSPKIETVPQKIPEVTSDFEAGIIFNKYAKSHYGLLTGDEFRTVWQDFKASQILQANSGVARNMKAVDFMKDNGFRDNSILSFDAEQIFAQFDTDRDGKLEKREFEHLCRTYPEILRALSSENLTNEFSESKIPFELITGRVLTHFDETGGVAIPRSAVDQHKAMGNTVVPLLESYRSRYERLRVLVTGRLFPRREHLLQLRRQLQICADEVSASRKSIERETIADTDQIIDRLRAVETLRQSAIKHQMLQLEEELESIERLVKRVEVANFDEIQNISKPVLLLSAAPNTTADSGFRLPRAAQMVELIQQFADLTSAIERVSTKPLTVQTDFPTDDFPRETSDRLEILSRCDRYLHAAAVKDHMLWTALQEQQRCRELLNEERNLTREYAEEVASWAEVSQALALEVQRLKKENEKLQRRNVDIMGVLRDHHIFYAQQEKD